MRYLKWITAIISSSLAGIAMVNYLVCQPSQMTLFLILFIGAALGTGLIIWKFFDSKRYIPILLTGLALISGYLISTYSFLNQDIPHPLPEMVRSEKDSGEGHTAVIYFTHGEHESYSPNAWIETMRHLDKDGVPFIPKPFRPFFFNGFRGEYIEVGTSSHNQIHNNMLSSLQDLMHSKDDSSLRFYLSFLDTDPRPDAMVIQALNDGASQIILMPVFLTISSHTAEGFELVEDLDLDAFQFSYCIADPLWESVQLKEMFLTRSNANLGEIKKENTGVMLIGHGQPEEWDLTYPTQTEQENSFRESVKEILIEDGYVLEQVVLSWMEFKSPDIAESALLLADHGIEQILAFPASISADSIHTEIEIPKTIAEAGLPEEIAVHFMGSWNDDPLVIEGIRQNILDCLNP